MKREDRWYLKCIFYVILALAVAISVVISLADTLRGLLRKGIQAIKESAALRRFRYRP